MTDEEKAKMYGLNLSDYKDDLGKFDCWAKFEERQGFTSCGVDICNAESEYNA